jgi:hypothetical protein
VYRFLNVKIFSTAASAANTSSGEATLWVEDYALPQLHKGDSQWKTFHVNAFKTADNNRKHLAYSLSADTVG